MDGLFFEGAGKWGTKADSLEIGTYSLGSDNYSIKQRPSCQKGDKDRKLGFVIVEVLGVGKVYVRNKTFDEKGCTGDFTFTDIPKDKVLKLVVRYSKDDDGEEDKSSKWAYLQLFDKDVDQKLTENFL